MAVGFGIIGCGMIAGFHQKAIADIRGARVVECEGKIQAGNGQRADDRMPHGFAPYLKH